jgi:hypothetical protein
MKYLVELDYDNDWNLVAAKLHRPDGVEVNVCDPQLHHGGNLHKTMREVADNIFGDIRVWQHNETDVDKAIAQILGGAA